MERFAQSLAHNGASNGANSNQATIVRCVFSAALSGSGSGAQWHRKSARIEMLRGKM